MHTPLSPGRRCFCQTANGVFGQKTGAVVPSLMLFTVSISAAGGALRRTAGQLRLASLFPLLDSHALNLPTVIPFIAMTTGEDALRHIFFYSKIRLLSHLHSLCCAAMESALSPSLEVCVHMGYLSDSVCARARTHNAVHRHTRGRTTKPRACTEAVSYTHTCAYSYTLIYSSEYCRSCGRLSGAHGMSAYCSCADGFFPLSVHLFSQPGHPHRSTALYSRTTAYFFVDLLNNSGRTFPFPFPATDYCVLLYLPVH